MEQLKCIPISEAESKMYEEMLARQRRGLYTPNKLITSPDSDLVNDEFAKKFASKLKTFHVQHPGRKLGKETLEDGIIESDTFIAKRQKEVLIEWYFCRSQNHISIRKVSPKNCKWHASWEVALQK